MLSSFHVHLRVYHSSRAKRACYSPSCLASAYFFISPEFPVPPFPFPVYRTLCLTRPRTYTCTRTYYPFRLRSSQASNVLYRLALILEIETLTWTIVHAQWKERKRAIREGRTSHTRDEVVKKGEGQNNNEKNTLYTP